MGILTGYRVLDCSIAMAGPLAAQRLADMGADVIKIEPINGEWQRHAAAGGVEGNRINVSFLSLNRNKRSISVDLKSEKGRKVVLDLVKTSDVFLQNYRSGVAARLGVDYETLKDVNPGIIYVSMTGYGETGPYAKLPGQDLLLQAMSGAMMANGSKHERPMPAGQYLVDATTAYTAFEGALAALLHRERTGEGQKVEINMLDSIVAMQMQEMSVYTIGKVSPERTEQPHAHCYIRSPYGVFETSDGYIALAMPDLPLLGEILDIPAFETLDTKAEKREDRDWIFEKTASRFTENTSDYWINLLREHGVWVGPVYGYEDVVSDPQIIHNNTFIEYDHPTEGRIKTPGFPIKFSSSPCEMRYGAPLNGQHTTDILLELGYGEAEIEAMKHENVLHEDAL